MTDLSRSASPVDIDKQVAEIAPAQVELQHILASLDESLANEQSLRGWLRALQTPYRWLLAILTVGVMTVGVALLVPRANNFHYYAALRLWLSLGLYGLLLILLVTQALRPPHWIESSARFVYALGALALLTPYVIALWPGPAKMVACRRPIAFWSEAWSVCRSSCCCEDWIAEAGGSRGRYC